MSMEIRVGIESTRIEQIFWTSSSWYQILIIASMSFIFAEQSDFWRRFWWLPTSFLLDSGQESCQATLKPSIWLFRKKLAFFYVWQGALSCWKILFPSGSDCCIDGTNFVSNISWYLVEFIIPSIGHNLPVPLNVKHPQNIFFKGCFGAYWMWKLLRSSPALRLTYCDLWPCTSKWLSFENITFLTLPFPNVYIFLPKPNVFFFHNISQQLLSFFGGFWLFCRLEQVFF